jgi:hypothetical protein
MRPLFLLAVRRLTLFSPEAVGPEICFCHEAWRTTMKIRQIKRLHSERLRWRMLLVRVTEGVELRLIEKAAEVLARAAAEAVPAAYRTQADVVHLAGKEVERLLAGTQTHSH